MLMKADIEVTGSEKIFYRYNILIEFMLQTIVQNDIRLSFKYLPNDARYIGVGLIVYHEKYFSIAETKSISQIIPID